MWARYKAFPAERIKEDMIGKWSPVEDQMNPKLNIFRIYPKSSLFKHFFPFLLAQTCYWRQCVLIIYKIMQSSGDIPIVIFFFTWNTFTPKMKERKIGVEKKSNKVVSCAMKLIHIFTWELFLQLASFPLSYNLAFEPNYFFLWKHFS